MDCPNCNTGGGNTRVFTTIQTSTTTLRDKLCLSCNHKWKTIEIINQQKDLLFSNDNNFRKENTARKILTDAKERAKYLNSSEKQDIKKVCIAIINN